MKNYKIYSVLIALTLILGSCEREVIGEIIDNQNSQQVLSFESTSSDLPIEIDAVGSGQVVVEVSTISSVDRTFNVSVVAEETQAINGSYAVPANVTIPAGAYEGTITITGTDVAGVDVDPLPLVLELTAPAGVVYTNQRTTVNVFQICPIPEDYLVGSYLLVNTISTIGPAFGDFNLGEGNVTLSEGPSPTQRVFRTSFLPVNGGITQDVILNLNCGTIALGNTLFYVANSGIRHIPSTMNTTYDLTDDSEIIVNYIENSRSTNGLAAQESQFVLIKN